MRIISKFYDYYDKAVAYGTDNDLIYVREEKQIYLPFEHVDSKYDLFRIVKSIPQFRCGSLSVIAFCGKIYPHYSINLSPTKSKNYFSINDIKSDYEDGTLKKLIEESIVDSPAQPAFSNTDYKLSEIRQLFETKYWYSRDGKGSFIEQFSSNEGKKISDDVFRYYNSPIIVVSNMKDHFLVDINTRLNRFNFIKMFDPYMAYQEISMYLGNNLVKQVDPTVNFGDDLKRDIHGFDKFSFRKGKK